MRHFYDAGDRRVLTIEYDYEPEDKALRINGIQMEPDYPARMDILAVLVEGVDVVDLLSDATLADIEKQIWDGSK
jgi:hypothetical protein